MKKTFWWLIVIFIAVILIFLLFKNFLNSGILMIFSTLYFLQFFTALFIIYRTDKSEKPIYPYIYFAVAIVIFVVLFIKMIPA